MVVVAETKKTQKTLNKSSFYAQGLPFCCTACGECCSNHSGYDFVFLTPKDISNLANFLELPEEDFLRAYTREDVSDVVLKDKGEACIFLGKNGRCQIYEARPVQCRTFPFWPENMNEKVWNHEIKRDCPGVHTDHIVPATTIEELLSLQTDQK